MYRFRDEEIEVLLVHPGGPYNKDKDKGVWSIPKGEYSDNENPFIAAKREFKEETSFDAKGNFISLTDIKQSKHKMVKAWAFEGDCDVSMIISNTCEIEYPPHSGQKIEIPEVDRGEWFTIDKAKQKLLKGQINLVEELYEKIKKIEGKKIKEIYSRLKKMEENNE